MLYALAPAAFGQMGTTPRIVPNLFTSSYKSYFEDFDYPGFNYGTTNYVDYSFNGSDAASVMKKTNHQFSASSGGGFHTNYLQSYQVWTGLGWPMNGGSNYCWLTNWTDDGNKIYWNSAMVTNLGYTCPSDYTYTFGYQNTLVVGTEDPWGFGDPGDFYEKTVITTDARLWTGSSTNGSVTNLFKLHATVTSWTPGQTVTNSTIQIGGINCDTNGDIYIALPDNYWYTCTVTMPAGYSNYTYAMTVDRANLQFFRAGTNIANTTSSIIIGQKMAVTCTFQNPANNNMLAQITNYQWVVEGSVVTNFYVSTNIVTIDGNTFNKATNGYPVPFQSSVWNTNRPAVQFYWHAPATNKVYCLTTTRGFTIRSEAVFEVLSPDFTMTNTVGATITIDTNYVKSIGDLFVHFGGSSNTSGITFKVVTNSTIESNFSLQFVQVLTNVHTRTDYTEGALLEMTSPSYYLNVIDTQYPYDPVVGTNDYTNDSPGNQIGPYTDIDNKVYYPTNQVSGFNASMYLFYKSGQTSTEAIWVPLAVTPWSVSWDVTKTNGINGNWKIKSFYVPPLHPPSIKTNSYPKWLENVIDLPIQFYSPT